METLRAEELLVEAAGETIAIIQVAEAAVKNHRVPHDQEHPEVDKLVVVEPKAVMMIAV